MKITTVIRYDDIITYYRFKRSPFNNAMFHMLIIICCHCVVSQLLRELLYFEIEPSLNVLKLDYVAISFWKQTSLLYFFCYLRKADLKQSVF